MGWGWNAELGGTKRHRQLPVQEQYSARAHCSGVEACLGGLRLNSNNC